MWRVASGLCRSDLAQLEQWSYASEWSIAQVLSHLGSGAEIFGLFLQAGLAGQERPGRDTFVPIWNAWNAKDPQAQAADGLNADEATLERFEALDPDQKAGLRLHLFGMDTDIAGLARMRVSEHAVHTWDVAVALDPSARIAPDAVGLLIDTVGQLATWSAKPDGKARRIRVCTSDPERAPGLEDTPASSAGPSLLRKVIMTMRLRISGWPSGRAPQRNNRHIPCLCEH